MRKTPVPKLVGDLQHHVCITPLPDPLHRVDNARPYRRRVVQDLVLPLVITTEYNGDALCVAGANHPSDPCHIVGAQRAIAIVGRIDRTLVTRHSPL